MLRKGAKLSDPNALKDVELMPFMDKVGDYSYPTYTPTRLINSKEAVMACLPFFGGTAPTETESSSTESSSSSSDSSTTETASTTAGGDSESSSSDALTPEQIKDLVTQVSTLNQNVKTLQNENATYKSKEETARKATLGREEALTEDLNRAQQTNEQQDAVIKSLAIINAIQGNKDLQFHDARDVIARLDENAYELVVDLESGKAEVTGIDAELKRIAKDCSWLVKNNALDQQQKQQKPPTQRGSGAPPPPVGTGGNKGSTRAALIDRFPVIAHGRRAV